MHGRRWLVAMVLTMATCLAGTASAQVYKCKGSNGETVYSQNRCGAGAQEVSVRETRPATPSSSETATRSAVFRSTDLSDASIAERNCVGAARSSIYAPVDARIAGYQRQIGDLNQQISRSRDNLAGATSESGIRGQITGLQQSISAERQTAETSMGAARQRCGDERRDREAAIEKKYDEEQQRKRAAAAPASTRDVPQL